MLYQNHGNNPPAGNARRHNKKEIVIMKKETIRQSRKNDFALKGIVTMPDKNPLYIADVQHKELGQFRIIIALKRGWKQAFATMAPPVKLTMPVVYWTTGIDWVQTPKEQAGEALFEEFLNQLIKETAGGSRRNISRR